ncbi:MAG: hypothetical protein PHC91_11835 [Eubacteriales bacterium]|nr:hypothetical protein [Eubacteriales bacterium]
MWKFSSKRSRLQHNINALRYDSLGAAQNNLVQYIQTAKESGTGDSICRQARDSTSCLR